MRKPRSNSWVSTTVSSLTNDDQRPHTSTEISPSPSSKLLLHFPTPETSSASAGMVNLRGDRGDGCVRKADQTDPHCSKGSHTFDRQATELQPGKNLQADCSSNFRPKPSVSFVNPDPVLRSASPFPLYDGVLRSGSPYPKPEWLPRQHHTPSKSPMFLRSQSPFVRSELSLKADTPLRSTSPSMESVLRSGSPYPNPESRIVKSVHSSTSLFTSSERPVFKIDGSSSSNTCLYKHNIIKRYVLVEQKGKKTEKSQSSINLTCSVSLNNKIGHYHSTPSSSSFLCTKHHLEASIYASKTPAPPILKSSPSLRDCSQKKAASAKRKMVTYQNQPGNDFKRPNKKDAGKTSIKNVRLPEVVGEAPRGLSPTDDLDEDEDEDDDDDEFDDEEDLLTDDEDEDNADEYEESLEYSEKEKAGKKKAGKKRKGLTDLKNTLGWDQTTVIVVVVFVLLRLLVELVFSDSERLASFFSQPKDGEPLEEL